MRLEIRSVFVSLQMTSSIQHQNSDDRIVKLSNCHKTYLEKISDTIQLRHQFVNFKTEIKS